jgi:hypothetical protein
MFKDLNKKKSIYETNIIIGYIITGLAFVFIYL